MGATKTPVIVFDLSTLRFVWQQGRRSLALLTSAGEMLAVTEVADHTGERQAAFAILEEAAATARLRRQSVDHRVAFYNPYTAEVSIEAGTANRVFCSGRPLALPENGVEAVADDLVLRVGSIELTERGELDPASAMMSVAAHLDPR